MKNIFVIIFWWLIMLLVDAAVAVLCGYGIGIAVGYCKWKTALFVLSNMVVCKYVVVSVAAMLKGLTK